MKHLLILIILVFPKMIYGQVEWLDSLDNFISKEIITFKIPGLAIGIIKDNKVIFKHSYGVTSVNTKSKVTPETVFSIASCTKAFTATCIGILVDEEKLQWDDKVIKYLPDFKLSDPWVTKELTISDLLTHRSGLAQNEGDILWYGTNYSPQEIVSRMQYYPLKNNFRLQFGYQNVMYLVAGMIIEKVSGKTWGEFVKEKILTPLSMNHTSTNFSQLPINNIAQPHVENRQIPLLNTDNAKPEGGIISNIPDMLSWTQLWLNKGIWEGKSIISEDVYQAMISPKMFENSEINYGFGWYVASINCEKVFYNNGVLPGYRSTVYVVPERKIGIVILTNSINLLDNDIVELIIDNFVNPGKTNWKNAKSAFYNRGCSNCWDAERKEIEKLNTDTPSDYSKYVGMYEDKIYGKAKVSQKIGRPFLELLPTKDLFSGYMYFIKENQFAVILNDRFLRPGKVNFEIDSATKQIVGFKLDILTSDFNFKDLDFERIK